MWTSITLRSQEDCSTNRWLPHNKTPQRNTPLNNQFRYSASSLAQVIIPKIASKWLKQYQNPWLLGRASNIMQICKWSRGKNYLWHNHKMEKSNVLGFPCIIFAYKEAWSKVQRETMQTAPHSSLWLEKTSVYFSVELILWPQTVRRTLVECTTMKYL